MATRMEESKSAHQMLGIDEDHITGFDHPDFGVRPRLEFRPYVELLANIDRARS